MANILAPIQDWLSLFLRWAHIIAAIGWIGSSFYFMWLDATLKRRAGMSPDVTGENWTVHGGGFYHTVKYRVAPESMPEDLHWFRLESYFTWLTGFALLAVLYYWSASSYLLHPGNDSLAPWAGVGLSLLGLAVGWVFYDRLCRSALRTKPMLLFAILFVAILVATWGFGFVFSGRATFVQVGAMIASIMTANVLLVIIPNQRVVVADLKAGRTPDPSYGEIAKLRSTHNNYLTLPVIFLMISNHYPMTFGSEWSLAIVAVVLVMGAIVRNWFNRYEAGETGVGIAWQWPATIAMGIGLALTSILPAAEQTTLEDEVSTAEMLAIVQLRCATCHSANPTDPGFDEAPGGVALDTVEEVRTYASRILSQSVLSDAMPLGNVTEMTAEERQQLGAWLRSGQDSQ